MTSEQTDFFKDEQLLTIIEHSSSSYVPRTKINAGCADVTVAFALDFQSAGERLTKREAGRKLVSIGLDCLPADAMSALTQKLERVPTTDCLTLNVAGNGIYTLGAFGWSQADVDSYIHAVIAEVHSSIPIKRIVCGGQTGADLAGAVAGVALGIQTVVTMPKGFLQRGLDRRDREHSKDEIAHQINSGVARLNCLAVAISERDLPTAVQMSP